MDIIIIIVNRLKIIISSNSISSSIRKQLINKVVFFFKCIHP